MSLSDTPDFKTPVLARCLRCEHVWPVAWTPMEMSAAARAIMAHSKVCPACGTASTKKQPIVMADESSARAWNERFPCMATEVKA